MRIIHILKMISVNKPLNIIFEGDSLTDVGLWVDLFLAQLEDGYTYNNIAHVGDNINDCIDRIPTADNLYDVTRENILFIWIGTNDASNASFSISDFNLKLTNYYNTLKSKFKIIVIGLTSLASPRTTNALTINNWHITHSQNYSDLFIDIYQIPECQDYSNTLYFTDGVHHTEALDILISDYIYTNYLTL